MDLTLFEVNIDGAQFGPATVGTGPAEEAEVTETVEGGPPARSRSAGRGDFPLGPLVVAVGAAAGYVASRRFGGETMIDAEAIEIED